MNPLPGFWEMMAASTGNQRLLKPRLTNRNGEQRLIHHVYDRMIGPAIQREQVHLRNTTPSVIAFWKAVQGMCAWITALLWEARKPGKPANIDLVFSPEQEVSIPFFEEGWSDTVVLSGIADLVLKIPGSADANRPRLTQNAAYRPHPCPDWCVVEFKLGIACPEADLAQVCLYHQMLSEQTGASSGAMAYIRFSPDKTERIFMPDEIQSAQKHLKNLIGRLAGVLPGESAFRGASIPECSGSAEQPIRIAPGKTTGIHLQGIRQRNCPGWKPCHGADVYPVFHPAGKRGEAVQPFRESAKEIQHRMELGARPIFTSRKAGSLWTFKGRTAR